MKFSKMYLVIALWFGSCEGLLLSIICILKSVQLSELAQSEHPLLISTQMNSLPESQKHF